MITWCSCSLTKPIPTPRVEIMKTLSKELLDEGADVNAQSEYYGEALRTASLRRHISCWLRLKIPLKKMCEVSGACTLLGSGFFAFQNLCISTKTLASETRKTLSTVEIVSCFVRSRFHHKCRAWWLFLARLSRKPEAIWRRGVPSCRW